MFLLNVVFSKMLAVPLVHQPKVFNYPHNESFNFLQLFMSIQLNSFVMDNHQFLQLMVMGHYSIMVKLKFKTVIETPSLGNILTIKL